MMPPELLAPLPQWLGYRKEWQPERGKYTKKPVSPHNGGPGSSTNPTTWGFFEQAMKAVHRHGLDGVGFVLSEQDPFTAIDLDGCRNPETGEIAEWAERVVDRFRSYTEISPSGTGLHIIVAGSLPVPGRRSGSIEVYHSGRYITVTGDVLPGFEEIHERSDELAGWFAETFPVTEPQDAARWAATLSLADEDVLQRIGSAKNGPAFLQLYAGDMGAYGGDHSRADQALVSMLAFWTQDPDQLDRLYRSSGLMREKWEKRADYRRRTIERALSGLTETYNPARPSLDNNRRAERHSAPLEAEAPTGDTGANETIAALQAQIAELQERVRIAEAEAMQVAIVRATNLELAESQRRASQAFEAVRAVLSVSNKTPREKLVGLATVFEMHDRKKSSKYTDDEGYVSINRDGVKRRSGLAVDLVTDSWKTYKEAGHDWGRKNVSRTVEDDSPKGFHRETDIWLKPRETLVEDLQELVWIETPRKQGGKKPETPKVYCENCKSFHVTRKQYTECQGCGDKWDDTSYDINQRNAALAEKAQRDEQESRERLLATPINTKSREWLLATRENEPDSRPSTPTAPAAPPRQWTLPPPGEGIEEIKLWPDPRGRLN